MPDQMPALKAVDFIACRWTFDNCFVFDFELVSKLPIRLQSNVHQYKFNHMRWQLCEKMRL